jgi:hypothetical protein
MYEFLNSSNQKFERDRPEYNLCVDLRIGNRDEWQDLLKTAMILNEL